MSYLVLARKYRPQRFADLVGQEHVVRTLQNAMRLDRVHHAFLFTGARGVGKTSSARLLARALNCEQLSDGFEPCGECASCVAIGAGQSPDVLEIDGASHTGVDHVRELRDNVRYLPSQGRYKLYIIDEVHMLSQAAFNALLKTLEEPPAHAKFIFATTEPQKIPATILSRCQRFDFRRLSLSRMQAHLAFIVQQEGLSLGASAVAAIAREAQGSVRDGLSLLDQVLSYSGDAPADDDVLQALGVVDQRTVTTLAQAVLSRDGDSLLRGIAEVDARGHDLPEVASLLVSYVRDLMVAKVAQLQGKTDVAAYLGHCDDAEIEALTALSQNHSGADLHRIFERLVAAAEDTARSMFPRVTLEMGLLRVLEVAPVADLKDLLGRVDALLRQGGQEAASAGAPVAAAASPATLAAGPASVAATPAVPAGSSVPSLSPLPSPAPATHQPAAEPGAVSAPSQPAAASQSAATTVEAATGAPSGGEHDGWRRFVASAGQARPALASVLEHARLLAFGPDGVKVGYRLGTFYWDAVGDRENRAFFVEQLKSHFGQEVPFEVVPMEGDADTDAGFTLAESDATAQAQVEQAMEDAVLQHPAVRGAVEVLGGQVQQVEALKKA